MRWVILLLALVACSNKPSKTECTEAASRMLDLFAAPKLAPGSSATTEQNQLSESWKKALHDKDPNKDRLFDVCRKRMTKDHVECIRHATDEKSLAKCFSDD